MAEIKLKRKRSKIYERTPEYYKRQVELSKKMRHKYPDKVKSAQQEYHRKYGSPNKRLREIVISFILARDGNKCQLCDMELLPGHLLDLDHILPLSYGGKNTHDNIRLAHRTCNRRRNRTVENDADLRRIIG